MSMVAKQLCLLTREIQVAHISPYRIPPGGFHARTTSGYHCDSAPWLILKLPNRLISIQRRLGLLLIRQSTQMLIVGTLHGSWWTSLAPDRRILVHVGARISITLWGIRSAGNDNLVGQERWARLAMTVAVRGFIAPFFMLCVAPHIGVAEIAASRSITVCDVATNTVDRIIVGCSD